MEEAIRWLIDSFERTSSEKTARGYWQVPRSFGLLETQGERLTLTPEGATYITQPTPDVLLELLKENVAGFTEMLQYLAERPQQVEELLKRTRADLGVTWETDAQINFRLGWLKNLGAAESHGDSWRLTAKP